MAKIFIVLGVLLTVIGILMLMKVNFSWLGRLPGDFSGSIGKTRVYIPVVTCIIASVVLNLIFYLISFFKAK